MLNKSKSYFMIFKPKGGKTIPITEKMHINNTEIERVKVTRFLGIWIDEDLKFNKQFGVLQKKLENMLRALAAICSIMNYRAKLLRVLLAKQPDISLPTFFGQHPFLVPLWSLPISAICLTSKVKILGS